MFNFKQKWCLTSFIQSKIYRKTGKTISYQENYLHSVKKDRHVYKPAQKNYKTHWNTKRGTSKDTEYAV